METPTATALYEDRLTRSTEALAIEVVAMRALIDALMENMATLKAHIVAISIDTNSPAELVRGAGGMAALGMLDDWLMNAIANLNDVATEAAAQDWD